MWESSQRSSASSNPSWAAGSSFCRARTRARGGHLRRCSWWPSPPSTLFASGFCLKRASRVVSQTLGNWRCARRGRLGRRACTSHSSSRSSPPSSATSSSLPRWPTRSTLRPTSTTRRSSPSSSPRWRRSACCAPSRSSRHQCSLPTPASSPASPSSSTRSCTRSPPSARRPPPSHSTFLPAVSSWAPPSSPSRGCLWCCLSGTPCRSASDSGRSSSLPSPLSSSSSSSSAQLATSLLVPTRRPCCCRRCPIRLSPTSPSSSTC
mmetsp:Transcript_43469/g.90685  ORF Transcript_43469/g.90685 Transcript_43469/m.90685 type:complete len:264 (-) Transcript_43469:265-1056(-)